MKALKLLQFLQEESGCLSSTRLAFLLWVIGTLVVWIICSLKDGMLLEIPQSVEIIIGILMTGKVTQKFSETKKKESDNDSTP